MFYFVLCDFVRRAKRCCPVLSYPASEKLYTERDEAFNKKLVDGAVDTAGEEEGVTDEEAARTERLYAIRAHLEHEFDAVREDLRIG